MKARTVAQVSILAAGVAGALVLGAAALFGIEVLKTFHIIPR